MAQKAAFASGVPPDIYAFHRSTGIPLSSTILKLTSFGDSSRVKPGDFIYDLISHLRTLYAQ